MRSALKSLALGAALLALPSCIVGDGLGGPPDESSSNAPGDADGPLGTAQQGITVSGMGHYCSMTWPGGGWAFSSNPSGGDPCGDITAGAPGGTIRRAGVYSAAGTNNVVARCDSYMLTFKGTGNTPLTNAFNWALGKAGCVFTVAPKAMPIFDSPFLPNAVLNPPTGFDFAWRDGDEFYALHTYWFGESPGALATSVDWKGRARTWGNNHDAWDWGASYGTPVRAVADGTVRKARWFDTKCKTAAENPCTASDSSIQGEIYIDHTVSRSPDTYNETFTSAYFHLLTLAVADGQTVTKGQTIGTVGNGGWSSGPHLHFAVIRLTNTSADWRRDAPGATYPLTINLSGNNGFRSIIDPYGWDAPQGFDPRGSLTEPYGAPNGALSINLWSSGQAPTTGTW